MTRFLIDVRSTAAPEEACGLLFEGDTGGIEAMRTPNASEHPQTSFLIGREVLLNAAVSGRLIGCWHTHPEGPAVPSLHDAQALKAWPDLVHLVVGPRIRAWRWSPDGPIPVPITSEGTPGLLWSARP